MSKEPGASLSDQDLRQIISRGESQTVEFKRGWIPPNRLASVITAFANADGGLILMGVEESGKIVGIDASKIHEAFEEAVSQIEPRPEVNFQTVIFDSKSIAVINITRTNRVVIADDGAFIRTDSITKAMTTSELFEKLSSASSEPNITQLADAVAKQTATIEHLREELSASNSLASKMTDYFIGGIIGAILGALLTVLL